MIGNDQSSGDSTNIAAVVRQRLADNLRLVIVVFLVLAAIGGWVSYAAHVNPPTESSEQTIGTVETTGEYEHGAIVRSENPVYPVDTTLQDRRHYFHSISPVLNGTFTHEYTAGGDDVVTKTTLSLQMQSADDEGEYWSDTKPLADRRIEGDDGEKITVPFEVNITETTHQIAETDDQLGGSPGDPEIMIVAESTVSATIEGERVTTTTSHKLPVTSSGSTYTVGSAETNTATEQATRTVDVPREYGLVTSYGAVLLFLTAIASLGLIIGSHRKGMLEPAEPVQKAVTTARERKTLDEWITTGKIPSKYRNDQSVSVTSLSGLVDIAIDCDRRVIEDKEYGEFYVVDGNVVYTFEHNKESADLSSAIETDEPADIMDEEFEWSEMDTEDDS